MSVGHRSVTDYRQTSPQKRAFTLVELLVVVAILALLAAILFPVFAQAKTAAKGAASINHAKQITLALTLYLSDHDDKNVIASQIGDPAAPFGNHRPWSNLLLPYCKSSSIFQDPLTQPFKPPGWTEAEGFTYHTQFAYAWQIHSPATFSGGLNLDWNVQSATGLADPARTVLLATKRSTDQGTNWWWGPNYGITTWNTIGVPHCQTAYTIQPPRSLCGPAALSWGKHSVVGTTFPDHEGWNTGGFAYRKTGKGTVAFADGHTKSMSPQALAVGTNWTPTINNWEVRLMNQDMYLWDNAAD